MEFSAGIIDILKLCYDYLIYDIFLSNILPLTSNT